MKKQIFFVIALFSLVSCTEDIRFNDPSFQGVKDNVFWRAIESRASISPSGSLIIEAYTGNEEIILKMPSPTTVVKQEDKSSYITHALGTSNSKTAVFIVTQDADKITYTTGIDRGDGEIIITEYDDVNNTISGTFKFNAENTDGNSEVDPVLNFQYGFFYKVPLVVKVP